MSNIWYKHEKNKVMVVSKKESPVITIFAEQTKLEPKKE